MDDIQLRRGRTNQYCFVTVNRSRAMLPKYRGEIKVELKFVEFVRGANVDRDERILSLAEFDTWYAANPAWHVVD